MRTKLRSLLVVAVLLWGASASAQTQVIAHRGYWDCAGSAQNSLTSLRCADRIGVYGSEFDVYITQDGHTVVHHDPEVAGVRIEQATYGQLSGVRLSNGEPLPTLQHYLDAGRGLRTRLILEVKPHEDKEREARCVDEVLRQVKASGLADRVEYISFSMAACQRLHAGDALARVAYLGGDVAPRDIKAMGLTGIDYHGSVLALHPEWIDEAHGLGLTVNVWTVNDLDDVARFVKAKADYITTDRPVEAARLTK